MARIARVIATGISHGIYATDRPGSRIWQPCSAQIKGNCVFAQFPGVDDRVDSRAASVYGSKRPGSMRTPANEGTCCRGRRVLTTEMKGVDHGDRTG